MRRSGVTKRGEAINSPGSAQTYKNNSSSNIVNNSHNSQNNSHSQDYTPSIQGSGSNRSIGSSNYFRHSNSTGSCISNSSPVHNIHQNSAHNTNHNSNTNTNTNPSSGGRGRSNLRKNLSQVSQKLQTTMKMRAVSPSPNPLTGRSVSAHGHLGMKPMLPGLSGMSGMMNHGHGGHGGQGGHGGHGSHGLSSSYSGAADPSGYSYQKINSLKSMSSNDYGNSNNMNGGNSNSNSNANSHSKSRTRSHSQPPQPHQPNSSQPLPPHHSLTHHLGSMKQFSKKTSSNSHSRFHEVEFDPIQQQLQVNRDAKEKREKREMRERRRQDPQNPQNQSQPQQQHQQQQQNQQSGQGDHDAREARERQQEKDREMEVRMRSLSPSMKLASSQSRTTSRRSRSKSARGDKALNSSLLSSTSELDESLKASANGATGSGRRKKKSARGTSQDPPASEDANLMKHRSLSPNHHLFSHKSNGNPHNHDSNHSNSHSGHHLFKSSRPSRRKLVKSVDNFDPPSHSSNSNNHRLGRLDRSDRTHDRSHIRSMDKYSSTATVGDLSDNFTACTPVLSNGQDPTDDGLGGGSHHGEGSGSHTPNSLLDDVNTPTTNFHPSLINPFHLNQQSLQKHNHHSQHTQQQPHRNSISSDTSSHSITPEELLDPANHPTNPQSTNSNSKSHTHNNHNNHNNLHNLSSSGLNLVGDAARKKSRSLLKPLSSMKKLVSGKKNKRFTESTKSSSMTSGDGSHSTLGELMGDHNPHLPNSHNSHAHHHPVNLHNFHVVHSNSANHHHLEKVDELQRMDTFEEEEKVSSFHHSLKRDTNDSNEGMEEDDLFDYDKVYSRTSSSSHFASHSKLDFSDRSNDLVGSGGIGGTGAGMDDEEDDANTEHALAEGEGGGVGGITGEGESKLSKLKKSRRGRGGLGLGSGMRRSRSKQKHSSSKGLMERGVSADTYHQEMERMEKESLEKSSSKAGASGTPVDKNEAHGRRSRSLFSRKNWSSKTGGSSKQQQDALNQQQMQQHLQRQQSLQQAQQYHNAPRATSVDPYQQQKSSSMKIIGGPLGNGDKSRNQRTSSLPRNIANYKKNPVPEANKDQDSDEDSLLDQSSVSSIDSATQRKHRKSKRKKHHRHHGSSNSVGSHGSRNTHTSRNSRTSRTSRASRSSHKSHKTQVKSCIICRKHLKRGQYVSFCNFHFCSGDGARGRNSCFQCARCRCQLNGLLADGSSKEEEEILRGTQVISNARGSIIQCGKCAKELGLVIPENASSETSVSGASAASSRRGSRESRGSRGSLGSAGPPGSVGAKESGAGRRSRSRSSRNSTEVLEQVVEQDEEILSQDPSCGTDVEMDEPQSPQEHEEEEEEVHNPFQDDPNDAMDDSFDLHCALCKKDFLTYKGEIQVMGINNYHAECLKKESKTKDLTGSIRALGSGIVGELIQSGILGQGANDVDLRGEDMTPAVAAEKMSKKVIVKLSTLSGGTKEHLSTIFFIWPDMEESLKEMKEIENEKKMTRFLRNDDSKVNYSTKIDYQLDSDAFGNPNYSGMFADAMGGSHKYSPRKTAIALPYLDMDEDGILNEFCIDLEWVDRANTSKPRKMGPVTLALEPFPSSEDSAKKILRAIWHYERGNILHEFSFAVPFKTGGESPSWGLEEGEELDLTQCQLEAYLDREDDDSDVEEEKIDVRKSITSLTASLTTSGISTGVTHLTGGSCDWESRADQLMFEMDPSCPLSDILDGDDAIDGGSCTSKSRLSVDTLKSRDRSLDEQRSRPKKDNENSSLSGLFSEPALSLPSIIFITIKKQFADDEVGLSLIEKNGATIVAEVSRSGLFAATDLREGCEILSINGHRVRSPRSFVRTIKDAVGKVVIKASSGPSPPGASFSVVKKKQKDSRGDLGISFEMVNGLVRVREVSAHGIFGDSNIAEGDICLSIDGIPLTSANVGNNALSLAQGVVALLMFPIQDFWRNMVDLTIDQKYKKWWKKNSECTLFLENGAFNPITLHFDEGTGLCSAQGDDSDEVDVTNMNAIIKRVMQVLKDSVKAGSSKGKRKSSRSSSLGSSLSGSVGSRVKSRSDVYKRALVKLNKMKDAGALSEKDYDAAKQTLADVAVLTALKQK